MTPPPSLGRRGVEPPARPTGQTIGSPGPWRLPHLRWLGSSLLLTAPWIGWELGERWSHRADGDLAPEGRAHEATLTTDQAGISAGSGALLASRGLPVLRLPGSPDPRDILAVRSGSGVTGSALSAAAPPSQGRFSLGGPDERSDGPGAEADAVTSLSNPWLITSLSGAAGLGGEINLDNVSEKAMPVAARAERLHWQRLADPLAALPRQWRDELRRELGSAPQQVQAEVVRLPAPHLQQTEEVPLAIHSNGEARSLVPPPSAQSQKLVETWASRQSPLQEGAVRAVVVTLEPISLTPQPAPVSTAPAPLAEPAPAGPESSSAQASPPTAPSP